MTTNKPENVSAYIASFPKEIQQVLEQIRATIKKEVPEATEVISYGMPAYQWNGILVYFAAFKNHIGFYATPTGHEAFKDELAHYKTGKGSVQFPLNKPMPLDLIAKIVQFRVNENNEKAQLKVHNKLKP
jgi:uncharacterized protein YdhG (YjbR/CyaY superfamily)